MNETATFISKIAKALEGRDRNALIEVFGEHRSSRQFRRFLEEMREAKVCRFSLVRNGLLVGEVGLLPGERAAFDGIMPGRYSLMLSTGRILWEGELTEEDLNWEEGYSGQDLPLAAASEDLADEPTKRMILAEGEVIMTVFASLEQGRIVVELMEESE